MEKLHPNLQPTLVDPASIEQLNPLTDSTDLLEELRKNNFSEEVRKVLRRSSFFTEDERAKFKVKNQFPAKEELPKTEIKSKTITAIVIVSIMIVVSIIVSKKHKRLKKEDLELLSNNSNTTQSIFQEIRSTDIGCNALIAGEIFMYLIIVLGFAYMIKNITHQTNETFS